MSPVQSQSPASESLVEVATASNVSTGHLQLGVVGLLSVHVVIAVDDVVGGDGVGAELKRRSETTHHSKNESRNEV